MGKLKDFHKTFAWELVRTNSGAQAYLNAKGRTAVTPKDRIRASVSAGNLLKNEQVRKYIQTIRDNQRIGVTEVIDELANIVRFDPIDLLNDDGTVKAIKDMPETARKMIAGLEVSELWFGRGENREQYGVVKKIKFIPKMDAIEKLMKHLGAYKEDNDQKKAVTQIAIFQLPDNERGDTKELTAVTIGELIPFEEVEVIVDSGKPGLFSSVGADKGKGEPSKDKGEPSKDKGEPSKGSGVQDTAGPASHLYPNIQTEFGPGD